MKNGFFLSVSFKSLDLSLMYGTALNGTLIANGKHLCVLGIPETYVYVRMYVYRMQRPLISYGSTAEVLFLISLKYARSCTGQAHLLYVLPLLQKLYALHKKVYREKNRNSALERKKRKEK